MKFLYLVRHAKTIQGSGDLKDFDRYLKSRGQSDAKLMAEFISENHIAPGLLISSPAKRARQTAEIFAETFSYEKNRIQFDKSIYFGGIGDIIDIFQNLSPDINNAMLVGHNPTIFEMVNYFISSPVFHFPTCCIAGIQFDVDYWIDLKAHSGKLVIYETPKNLR